MQTEKLIELYTRFTIWCRSALQWVWIAQHRFYITIQNQSVDHGAVATRY